MSPTSAYLTPILRSTTGSLYAAYPGTYNLWLFDPTTLSIFNYCAHMPSCFCEACSRRGINSSSSSFRFQS